MSFDSSTIMIIFKGKEDVGWGGGRQRDAALINRIITGVKSAGLGFLQL